MNSDSPAKIQQALEFVRTYASHLRKVLFTRSASLSLSLVCATVTQHSGIPVTAPNETHATDTGSACHPLPRSAKVNGKVCHVLLGCFPSTDCRKMKVLLTGGTCVCVCAHKQRCMRLSAKFDPISAERCFIHLSPMYGVMFALAENDF